MPANLLRQRCDGRNKRGVANGLWLGTDAGNGIAHASFDRGLAAGGDSVSGFRPALHRAGGAGGAKRHQDLGLGISDSGRGKSAAGFPPARGRGGLWKKPPARGPGFPRRARRAGRDLIAEEEESRAAAASRLTIEKLIELYVRRRVTGRLRTAKEIESRLRRALTPILHRYADDIRRRDIRELLDAVADQGIEREAEKRRQTVGAMFRWALSQDIVETNATAGLKAYDPGTPRDRVLTVGEIEA